MATDIKNPFVYGFYDAEDPFMPIAVQMCGNVQAAIDAGLSTISITGDSLTYTLTVNGKNAGTINIPSFVDDVAYDERTKELVFKYGDQYIRVNVSDLVDTYTAGEGISISGNQITCTLKDEVQSLQDKDREIVNSINNVYTKEEIDNKGFLTSHQDISGKADVSALNAVQQEVTANAANIADLEVAVNNKLDATAYTPTDLSAYAKTADVNSAIENAVAPKANAADVYTKEVVDNALATKQDKGDYALRSEIPAVPTNVSDFTNDANYQTETDVNNAIKAVVGAAPEALDTLEEIAKKLKDGDDVVAALTATVSAKANSADVYTKTEFDNKGYLTEHQSLSAYSTTEQMNSAISDAVATKANSADVYTKSEVDAELTKKLDATAYTPTDLSEYAKTADVEASQNAQDVLIVSKADANSVLSRIQMLEEKIASLSKTNVESVNVSESTENLNDSAKDYVLNGNATSTLSVTGKSVTLSNANVSNDARVKINAGDVEIKGTEFSGEFAKPTSNAVVSLNSAEYVSIKDVTFDATSSAYNAIEIGLNSAVSTLPKSVLIENCKFEGALSNNAILVFATQDNAVININNCAFENVSNVLRLSNRTNAKNITVNVTNCTVNKWDKNPDYAGFLICEDYTSTTAASAEENNLFGDGKITVNFINLVGPNGKVTAPSDMSTVCGSRDANQLVYVYRDKSGLVTYNESKYPVIHIL